MNTIRENILTNLVTTLEAVKAANGYDNTIASVQRYKQRGNSTVQVPCIIITAGIEDENPSPNPLTTCKLTVHLDIWMRQDETDTTATDTVLNSLLGDIKKALAVDITRGGYAIDTNILSTIPFDTVEGQSACGLIMSLEVVYRHQQTDPKVAG
ncbi:MAG: hypothetical protein HZB36_02465 [Candidatus Omnitrophica bacterium]|nr:hypothetical protein [Candidatus Omnitrophota bacterium]